MRMETGLPMSGYRPFPNLDDRFNIFDRAFSGAGPATGVAPYNVVSVDPDHYRIVLAVPGFRDADLEIISEPNRLTITGKPRDETSPGQVVYRGIGQSAFRQSWQLADHVRVDSARLEDGLLTVELVRDVPEELKPKRIQISAAPTQHQIPSH